jgi:two-component system sensor histidine kinase RegB
VSSAEASATIEPEAASDRISLRRLVLIRWFAVTGQALALVVVHYGLGFRVPLIPAFAVVGCSVLFNLGFLVSRRAATRLGEREATLFLGYDTLQLAGLLYLTGGLENPFAILMLAPVTVGATVLSQRPVIGLAGFAIAAITGLALWHMPLPWQTEPLVFPPELIFGLWAALVFATVFIGGYTWTVAREARRLRDAVAATQLALAREQRVSAVGALAAAAAHELGSPLATIAVVARELARDLPADSPHSEDAMLLLSQIERCRRILAELAQRPQDDGGSPYARLPISALVEAAGTLYHDPRVRLIFAATGAPAGAEPLVQRSPEIMHGLHNFIQNAVQFARREVSVTTFWDSGAVTVEIADDGPGFPANLLGRLGEPYLSSRADTAGHMGLGIFIAQSLLVRTGAELAYANLEEGGGAHVAISWKRDNLEAVARHPAAAGAATRGSERQPA